MRQAPKPLLYLDQGDVRALRKQNIRIYTMSYGLGSTSEKVVRRIEQRMRQSMHHHWKSYVLEGVIFVVLGAVAAILPNIATIAIDAMIGWVLMVAGIYAITARLSNRNAHDFWQGLVLGALTAILGGIIAYYPASGIVTLTMLLIAYFIAHGLGMISMAISARPQTGNWLWFLLGALIDFALAALVLTNWPSTASWLLGLYVGLNLMFTGLGIVFAALGARHGQSGSAN
jgi:uncharacterized membrane protein HdeD (DUF308 family)